MARVAEARLKHPDWKYLKHFDAEPMFVREQLGLPYHPEALTDTFAIVRTEAQETVPSTGELLYKDFRGTFVIDLVRRGLSNMMICSRTGHSNQSVQMICDHYVELHDDTIVKAAADAMRRTM